MFELIKTDANNVTFVTLVKLLDQELNKRDGDDHAFYHQFNGIENLNHVIIALEDGIPVGCGAIKAYDDSTMEVKRMYVVESQRGKGTASLILSALEKWAKSLGNKRCILETGKRQPEAIRLYQKNNYLRISNFGQYEGIENSLCFEKQL